MEREAAVTPETLLALLLRPEMLETGSVTGIVRPIRGARRGKRTVDGETRYPSWR